MGKLLTFRAIVPPCPALGPPCGQCVRCKHPVTGEQYTFPNRACAPVKVAVFDEASLPIADLILKTQQEIGYQFTERPAAKSSTNVAAGATVCRSCGCKKGGADAGQRAAQEIAARKNCDCVCHGGLK